VETQDFRLLFKKARLGDNQAKNRLFELLRARFYLLAKYIVGVEYADDVAQEACMTVAQEFHNLDDDSDIRVWAGIVLRNKIGNHIQKQKVRQKTSIAVDDPGKIPQAHSQEIDPLLRSKLLSCLKAVRKANPKYARALNLHRLGYSVEEICARMNVSRNGLYSILHRGRKLLKDCLSRGDES
jgi:RNA polymerase sigma factor (sigma-70 family)